MKPKRYIQRIWASIHALDVNGQIDKPDKFVAMEKLKIALTELENTFTQEIKDKKNL